MASVVTIGHDPDFPDRQTHCPYYAIQDCLLLKDATVGIHSESMGLHVEDNAPTRWFFVFHIHRRNTNSLKFRPALYVALAVRKVVTVWFGFVEGAGIENQTRSHYPEDSYRLLRSAGRF